MKWIALAVVLFPAVAWSACGKGQTEYKEGVCVVELQPAEQATADSSSWVSDAKPPKTTTGEWQTGKDNVINLPAQTEETEADDQIKYAKAHGEPPKGDIK